MGFKCQIRHTSTLAILRVALGGAALLAFGSIALPGEPDVAALYRGNCAGCHGADRLGGTGPVLLPESIGRKKTGQIASVIGDGRTATQMPSFAGRLSKAQIDALAAYVMTEPATEPTWQEGDIASSRNMDSNPPQVDKPVYSADPLNLFVVVETGDHHITILDGDKFEPLARFATHPALHGGPKFSDDGRYVYYMSRDGWVAKYDLWTLTQLGEVRAGINSRNIALSSDGKHIAVANYLPKTLVILSAETLQVEKIFPVADKKGNPSRVSAVYQAPQRKSFIAALKDVAEIWEIATDADAKPVYTGLVHSYEKGMIEALATSSGLFALRRIETPVALDDFFFDRDYRNLIGSSRDGNEAIVVNLNVGRDIARLPLTGLPHLGSGISWMRDGHDVMATPHLGESKISIIDQTDWTLVKTIATAGPGFFLRSHENTPYVWADVFLGEHKDEIQLIDKQTLEIVRILRPEPGKTAAHVEFDRYGKYALVSIWENDGAIIVYDAATLREVRRLPMSKPSGKYNVWNKTRFSEGTSH